MITALLLLAPVLSAAATHGSPPRAEADPQGSDIAVAGFLCDASGRPASDGRAFLVREGRIIASSAVEPDGWFAAAVGTAEAGRTVTLNLAQATTQGVTARELSITAPFTSATSCPESREPSTSPRKARGSAFLRFHVADGQSVRPLRDVAVAVTFEYGETLATVSDETGFASISYSPALFSGRVASWRVARPGYREEAGSLTIDPANPELVRVTLLPNALIVPLADLLQGRKRLPDATGYLVTDLNDGVRSVSARWEGGRQHAFVGPASWSVMLPAGALREDRHLVFDVVAPLQRVASRRGSQGGGLETALAALVRGGDVSDSTVRRALSDSAARASERFLFTTPMDLPEPVARRGPAQGPTSEACLTAALRTCMGIDLSSSDRPTRPVPSAIHRAFDEHGLPLRADAEMTFVEGRGWVITEDQSDRTRWEFRLARGADAVQVFVAPPATLVDGAELQGYVAQTVTLLQAARAAGEDPSAAGSTARPGDWVRTASLAADPLLVRYSLGRKARGEPTRHLALSIPVNVGMAYGDGWFRSALYVGLGGELFPMGARGFRGPLGLPWRQHADAFEWGLFLHPIGVAMASSRTTRNTMVTNAVARGGVFASLIGILQIGVGTEMTYESTPAWRGLVTAGYNFFF